MKKFFLALFIAAFPLAGNGQHSIRMMSYNVRNAQGLDQKVDYQRIADVINRNRLDVVALQELDSATNRSGKRNVLGEIALRTALYPTYAGAINYDGGKYGIGMLSKEKPLNLKRVALPGREEARVFLLAEFDDYYFGATHLSLNEEDRLASLEIIQALLEGLNKPIFLGGDLNDTPDSELYKLMKQYTTVVTDPKQFTFPANEPDKCIDYLVAMPGYPYYVKSRSVVNEPVASDHRPIMAEVSWGVKADQIFRTKPYLQNPVGNGITVTWLTNVPTNSWVEYGTDKSDLKKARTLVDGQVICNNFLHKIRLTDLEPGKTYYYRICSQEMLNYQAYSKTFGETAQSDFSSFTLPKSDQSDFTAIFFNDLHKRNATLQALCDQVKDEKIDFAVFNGDCIDDPANEDQALSFITAINEIVGADRFPVFYLRGNHEIRNAYSIGLRSLFDYVDDKTYSAFSWGDTRFILLDCGEDKPDETPVYYNLNDFSGLRNDQVKFLRGEFKTSAFKKAAKRVVVHHIPLYGRGSDDPYNPSKELWEPIMKGQPINLSINGHTHKYTFLEKNSAAGNPYPVVIGAGPSDENATIMVLKKRGKEMTLKVISAKGETLLDRNF